MHYYNYDYPMMDGYGLGGLFVMLFFVIFLIVVGVVVVRMLGRSDIGMHHKTDPIDTIKERYAKGEITKEQFEQLRKDLK
jgi:putative membrane protein